MRQHGRERGWEKQGGKYTLQIYYSTGKTMTSFQPGSNIAHYVSYPHANFHREGIKWSNDSLCAIEFMHVP